MSKIGENTRQTRSKKYKLQQTRQKQPWKKNNKR